MCILSIPRNVRGSFACTSLGCYSQTVNEMDMEPAQFFAMVYTDKNPACSAFFICSKREPESLTTDKGGGCEAEEQHLG